MMTHECGDVVRQQVPLVTAPDRVGYVSHATAASASECVYPRTKNRKVKPIFGADSILRSHLTVVE